MSTPDEIRRDRAKVAGIVASLAALPVLLFVFWIAGIYLSLLGGGTLGGYGAAAESAKAWWAGPAIVALLVFFVWVDVSIGVNVYRWLRRRGDRAAADE